MARTKIPPPSDEWPFPAIVNGDVADQSSLLDVVDRVLNKGAVLNGDLVLGVANVDLVYAKLSVLLSAFDKVGPRRSTKGRRSTKARTRRSTKARSSSKT